jgi:hypothetical protein
MTDFSDVPLYLVSFPLLRMMKEYTVPIDYSVGEHQDMLPLIIDDGSIKNGRSTFAEDARIIEFLFRFPLTWISRKAWNEHGIRKMEELFAGHLPRTITWNIQRAAKLIWNSKNKMAFQMYSRAVQEEITRIQSKCKGEDDMNWIVMDNPPRRRYSHEDFPGLQIDLLEKKQLFPDEQQQQNVIPNYLPHSEKTTVIQPPPPKEIEVPSDPLPQSIDAPPTSPLTEDEVKVIREVPLEELRDPDTILIDLTLDLNEEPVPLTAQEKAARTRENKKRKANELEKMMEVKMEMDHNKGKKPEEISDVFLLRKLDGRDSVWQITFECNCSCGSGIPYCNGKIAKGDLVTMLTCACYLKWDCRHFLFSRAMNHNCTSK